jgi:DNA-binding transcriptional LysR family regulator
VDLEAVRMFVKVAELGSFTRAAAHLGLSKARASLRVSELEAALGSRLLQRTTRAVHLTPDGEQFLVRARHWVAEADEIAAMFQAPSTLRGRVRIDLPVNLARNLIIPRLPEFFAAHPQLELLVSTTDRRVDVIREGFDCVLRVGALADSGLVARRLGELQMLNLASPAYLLARGTPRTLADLDGHLLVHYSLAFGTDEPNFEYPDRGQRTGYASRPMKSIITVNSADAYLAACVAGLGIIQTPRIGMLQSLASRAVVEVLPELTCEPMPVSLVHAHASNVPKRVRAVSAWLSQLLVPHLR